jgi:hypothetical protein
MGFTRGQVRSGAQMRGAGGGRRSSEGWPQTSRRCGCAGCGPGRGLQPAPLPLTRNSRAATPLVSGEHHPPHRLPCIAAGPTPRRAPSRQVMSVVSQLQDSGHALDLNVILDRLTSGRY